MSFSWGESKVILWSGCPLPDWHKDAECAKSYVPMPSEFQDIWFPDHKDYSADRDAIQICEHCPVRELCLQDALDNADVHGTRGGMTAKQRKQILEEQRWAS
jgi:hypothetical protein